MRSTAQPACPAHGRGCPGVVELWRAKFRGQIPMGPFAPVRYVIVPGVCWMQTVIRR